MTDTFLKTDIAFVKGVGPTRAEALSKELGIVTIQDILEDYPIRHEDRSIFHTIKGIQKTGEVVQLKGSIRNTSVVGHARKKRLVANFEDNTGHIELVWFKGVKWMQDSLKTNTPVIVFGRVSKFGRKWNIAHPEIKISGQNAEPPSFEPIYRSTDTLNKLNLDSKGRRKIYQNIIRSLKKEHLVDPLPAYVLEKLKLPSLFQAVKQIHFPSDKKSLEAAKLRLKFDELFISQMKIVKHYLNNRTIIDGYKFDEVGKHFLHFYHEKLTFELTTAQKRVLKEIRKDCKTGKQMNRLLQGDVGSGKTIVALMSMLLAVDNGFQACLMAPTEILSQQHYQSIQAELEGMGLRIALLTGSVKGSARKEILRLLQLGEIHILVGTHALIQDSVQYKMLGLAIIDEQHRFGVAQRSKLWKKGGNIPPHILVMTATPIPRTLHMTVYGDLDVSIIDELPPGRKPVSTKHKTDYHRPQVIKFLKREIKKGRQIYIVFPLIEESSALDTLQDLNNGYERLLQDFPKPDYQISVVHGRMKQNEKDYEMQRFVENKTHIMVATTVIEVGVNIPNASVMVIENSERFGLSQLHQLRGRVGRGAEQSHCILMTGAKLSQEGRRRIETMVQSNDGFRIAEVDLEIRGPGMIDSTQQSGLPQFKLADIVSDQPLLKTSREIAMRILEKDPGLDHPQHQSLKKYMVQHQAQELLWSQIS